MQYEIISRARHLRYVFFVEDNYDPAKLHKLFNENMHYWGGRVNPIVPVCNNEIHPHWKQLIQYLDPDYIMHTKGVCSKFILDLCNELQLHPASITDLDEPSNRINGMDCYYLLPSFERKLPLIKATGFYKLEEGIRDYYRINYWIDQYSLPNIQLEQNNVTIEVDETKLKDLNQTIYENKVFNKSLLAGHSLNTRLFRSKSAFTIWFELIIAKDITAFDDYIYFWNRRLFAPRNMPIPNVIVTIDQLDVLMQDQWFKAIIKDFPVTQNRVPLVSFSLEKETLQEVADKLKQFTEFNSFKVEERPLFPYDILDANGLYEREYGENVTVQIANSQEFHFQKPKLSFLNTNSYSNAQHYAIDLQITEIGEPNNQIKFPLTTESRFICNTSGRINKYRDLTLFINGSGEATLKIKTPQFFYSIQQIITRPYFLTNDPVNREPKYIYAECGYNDSSYRLKEFLKLFDSNFLEIESFFYDKFWADLFDELTKSIKVEGDTITFEELFNKCVNIFNQIGNPLGLKKQTYRNIENLKLGLTRTLQELCERKVFLIGYNIKCRQCSSEIWYSIEEIKYQMICKGCFNNNYFHAETPISYKLNHLIKNNIGMRDDKGKFHPNGNMTIIKTLLFLHRKLSGSFRYLPPLDIYKSYHSPKPETDIDIVCVDNGVFYIGECKHNSIQFKHGDENWKSIKNMAMLAETIKPDKIILACTVDEHNRLENAKIELYKKMQGWKVRPEVITYQTRQPEYFDLGDHKYFLH